MKKLIAGLFLFPGYFVMSQPKLDAPKPAPSVKGVIEKVARDYYQNFNNIKGDTLNVTQSTIEFSSKVEPADALFTSITKYTGPYSYSWQSLLFQTEDFEGAVAVYKKYFEQLNGCTLTFYNHSSYKLTGVYDTPDEGRTFASSLLALEKAATELSLFKVEVALNYAMPYWSVRIMVYEKVADDKIKPTVH